MVLAYNGHAGVRGISLPTRLGDTIVVEADVRGEEGGGQLQMMVGPDGMAWNRCQAQIIFAVGSRISYTNHPTRGPPILTAVKATPVIEPGEWYRLELALRPNPVRGGTYRASVNGIAAGPAATFDSFATEPTTAVRFGYMGRNVTGTLSVDNVSARPGPSVLDDLLLPDLVEVSLPERPPLGWRFTDGTLSMDLAFRGRYEQAKQYRVGLFPNHRNHPDEAGPEPARTERLPPPKEGESTVELRGVPFGMYTFRVSGVDAAGAEHVLCEELVAMVHGPPKQADPDEWVWGIDCHADRNDRRLDLEIDSLQSAGANWTRIEFLWRDMVDDQGNPDFRHHDRTVEYAAARGVRVFACLVTAARHATVVPGAQWGCPPQLAAYEKWLRTVFTHFEGRIRHYEILNEPDGYAFWWFAPGLERPEHHAAMMRTASEVAAEVSPDIRIMGPSATVIGLEYFRRLVNAGAFDGISDVSFHSGLNRHPRTFGRQLGRVLAERYPGRRFRFWSTEGGHWGGSLLRSFADPDPVRLFKYTVRDKGRSRASSEHNNGLVKHWGTPKELFIGYQNMARCFANSRYVGRALAGQGVEGYVFERKGLLTMGIWTDDGDTTSVVLPDAANAGMSVTDWIGNPVAGYAPETGVLPLPGLVRPHVVADIARDHPIALDASVNCRNDFTMATPVKPVFLRFAFENLQDRQQTHELSLVAPAGWRLQTDSMRVDIAPGQVAEPGAVRADIPHDTASGDTWLEGTLRVGGRNVRKRFGPIWVVNELRLKHVMVDDFESGDRWHVPEQLDIHTAHLDAGGNEREQTDLERAALRNRASTVSDPVFAGGHAGRFEFGWTRPERGWGWMACTFELREPVALPGTPVELRMKVFMAENVRQYPTTVLLKLRDRNGEVFLLEGGGEIYWSGWRQFRLAIPSFLGDGYVHSTWGNVTNRRIDTPVQFVGFVLNQPPCGSVAHFPPDRANTRATIVLDDLEVVYYE